MIYEDLEIEKTLAFKATHRGGFGCTYIIARLPQNAPQKPPKINLYGGNYEDSFAATGGWKPTPVIPERIQGERSFCIKGELKKLDGAGLDGYGPKIWDIIQSPNAWVSTHGTGQHQVMHVYAPYDRIIMRMRFGD